jgi:hypothetical protein
MVSTPNQPGGLFEQIEREPEDRCLYKRILLDYTYGLDKIYDRKEIVKAQGSPSFSREYDLFYGGYIGNVFSENVIQVALKQGAEQYDPSNLETAVNPFSRCVLAIDPGWGSSACGFCVRQLVTESPTDATNTCSVHSSDGSGNRFKCCMLRNLLDQTLML